jgi:Zn-dependent protease
MRYNDCMANIVYLIIALILSLTLHEFMHGLVATWLGDDTASEQGRLTLNPLAHIDPLTTLMLPLFLIIVGSPIVFGAAKPVPFKPWALRYGKWGAALVAVAGPLTNLTLAVFFGLWMRLVPAAAGSELLLNIVVVNLAFGFFNLVPFPPLDGSRVLYAAAPIGLREIMDRIERAGFIAIIVFFLLIYPLISPYVASAISAALQLLIPGAPGL